MGYPENYVFLKKNERDRRLQLAEWAALPPTYLTQFQREQMGYDLPEGKQEEANQLTDFVTEGERIFDEWLVKEDTTAISTAAVAYRKDMEAAYTEKARELGLGNYWASTKDPIYRRVTQALGLEDDPVWKWATDYADVLWQYIAKEGNVPGGSSDIAEWAQAKMIQAIRVVRADDEESAFNKTLNELSVALSPDDNPLSDADLVRVLFFDKWFPG